MKSAPFVVSAKVSFLSALRTPSATVCWILATALLSVSGGIQFRTDGVGIFAELAFSTTVLGVAAVAALAHPSLASPDQHFGSIHRDAQARTWPLDVGSAAGLLAYCGLAAGAGLLAACWLHPQPFDLMVGPGLSALALGLFAGLSVLLILFAAAPWLGRALVLVTAAGLAFVSLAPSLLPDALRPLVFPVSPHHLAADEMGRVQPVGRWYAAGLLHDCGLLLAWWAIARHRRR